jgi:hypothetical protein
MQCKIVTSGIIHKVVEYRVTIVSKPPAKPMAISNLIPRCRVKGNSMILSIDVRMRYYCRPGGR